MTFSRAHIISTLNYLDAALALLSPSGNRSLQEAQVAYQIQLAKARIMNACVVDTDVEPVQEGP